MIIRTVGDLHWKSGYDYLLQSCRLLVERGVSFQAEIIGNGPLVNELNFSIEDLGLDQFVSISHDDREAEVRRKISESDVFVVCAVVGDERTISLLKAALEMRIPVISTDFKGAELVVGANGRLVPVRDPLAMKEEILTRYSKINPTRVFS